MKKLLILLAFFSVMSTVHAQTWSRVSRCQDLGIDPIEPGTDVRLLEIYMTPNDEGIGGLGCWVFHHRNGNDYVITPHSWGPNPPPGKAGLIDDAMQAITDSRSEYEAIGTLSDNLYYILDDVRHSYRGVTYWIIGNACWMQSGAPSLRSDEGLAADSGDRKQTFAHEIGHCFVMKNVPDLRRYYPDNWWFDESVSEYLGSLVYPTNDKEHNRSKIFDFDGMEFRQKYNAYVLWYYYAKRHGNSAIVPLMNRLASYGTLSDRLKYLRSINFDELYHHFLFDFYKKQIYDSGGTGVIPSEDIIQLRQPEEDLIPEPSIPVAIQPIPSERLSLYSLFIPPDYDLVIKPPINSSKKAFFSVISEKKDVRDWTRPEKIEGNCGSFTEVNIIASHLQEDPVTDTKITYQLEEREGCCDAGLVVEANPDANNLNGQFSFDHYIESKVSYTADGEANSFPMNYFVNSKDGSMLLTQSWFSSAFGKFSANGMDAHAVIWFPNGQVVAYVLDKNHGQKRAITIDLNQTRNQIMGIQAMNAAELVRLGPGSGISPAPLPAGSPWQGNAGGIAINQPESSDPTQLNKISAYLSNESTAFSSPLPSFGFLTGYIRDANNRNKKLVYTKVELPGGDMYEGHLNSFEKKCFAFDGSGYKKMTLGASTGAIGAMTEAEREAFADSQAELHAQLLLKLKDLERCRGDKNCEARVTKEMMAIERRIQDAVYDLPENSEFRGNAASEFQDDQRAIRDEMHRLQEIILDHEVECERVNRMDASCGGCMQLAVERCLREEEDYKNRMHQLECKMARLQGVSDMFEDCPR